MNNEKLKVVSGFWILDAGNAVPRWRGQGVDLAEFPTIINALRAFRNHIIAPTNRRTLEPQNRRTILLTILPKEICIPQNK
jgi:hypothetical protein